jgi:hypothetical protein
MSWGAERLRAWRDRLNPEASSSRIGAGFGAIAGGTVLAVLGVALVVMNDLALLTRPSWLRELGFVAAASGLPLFLVGISVTLPSSWLERGTVGTGSLLVAGGVIAFSVWYPHNWHLTVQAPNGYAIASYLAGITAISAGTSSCLARHLVNSVRPVHKEAAERDESREWSDEEIRKDIRWAENQGYTWGGIPENQPQTEITLESSVESVEFKGRGDQFLVSEENLQTSEEGSQRLKAMRGHMEEDRTRVDDGTMDQQVSDLKQLKARKRQEQREKRSSLTWKLKHPIQWLRGSDT